MSSKVSALALAVAVFGAVGCSGVFVPKEQYDRDTNQLKEYIIALERDNGVLRPTKDAYEQLKADAALSAESNKSYADLAEALKKALGVEGDVAWDPRLGVFTLGTDLLFDSGKFEISPKGKEVLKKFAEANRTARLRIVGHTDPTNITRIGTKNMLFSDSNMELSALRAVAVWAELKKAGLKDMWVEGRGSSEPKPGGHAKCRRVEIWIVGEANGKTSNK